MDNLVLRSFLTEGPFDGVDRLWAGPDGRIWGFGGALGGLVPLSLIQAEPPEIGPVIWPSPVTADGTGILLGDLAFHPATSDMLWLADRVTGNMILRPPSARPDLAEPDLLRDPQGQALALSHMAALSQDRLFVASPARGSGLALYQLQETSQQARMLDQVQDTPKTTLDGVSDLLTLQVGDQEFVLAAASVENGLSCYAVVAGELELRDSLGPKDGLWVSGLEQMQSLTVAGVSYVVAVSAGSSSLSAMRVNPVGALFLTDQVQDDLHSRFQNAQALETVQIGGRGFIMTGGADQGVSLFELLPDGQIFLHQSLAQSLDWTLGPIQDLQAQQLGSELQILVSGARGAGVAQLSVSLADFGQLHQGDAGDDSFEGGAQDDLILGQGGDDHLSGQAGEDTLSAGIGQDVLSGGEGADVFVFQADGQTDRITDFEPGLDRIDLGGWGMVYDISALSFSSTRWGGRILWREEQLDIYLAEGGRLDTDLWRQDDFLF